MQANKRITHLTLNLGTRSKSRNRVHDYNIDGTGTDKSFCNVEPLLSCVRLTNKQFVYVNTNRFCVDGIQRVLCINVGRDTAPLLSLCNTMECNGSFTG